jgi:hypothetical protein
VHVVTMGHTHRPNLVPLSRGVAFVNTGTWASVSRWTDRNEPPGYRNYLLADFEDGRDPTVTLDSWHAFGPPTDGDVGTIAPPPTTPASEEDAAP